MPFAVKNLKKPPKAIMNAKTPIRFPRAFNAAPCEELSPGHFLHVPKNPASWLSTYNPNGPHLLHKGACAWPNWAPPGSA